MPINDEPVPGRGVGASGEEGPGLRVALARVGRREVLVGDAIIARELGVPCVSGVAEAAKLPRDEGLLTVDDFLGIVTVGPPELDLERAARP